MLTNENLDDEFNPYGQFEWSEDERKEKVLAGFKGRNGEDYETDIEVLERYWSYDSDGSIRMVLNDKGLATSMSRQIQRICVTPLEKGQ